MEKFEGNSNLSKQQAQERRVEAPVTSDVKVKKENSLARKFFAQDMKSTAKGVNDDIIIPGIKSLIVNILKKGVDYLFLGRSAPTNGYTSYNTIYSSPSKRVTYSSEFNPSQGINGPTVPNQRNTFGSLNEIIFPERGNAEEVLSRMNEIISRYGMVSVLDFYDLIDQGGRSTISDNKYGWKDLSTAKVDRCFEGYRIIFPRVIPLE